MRRQMAEQPDVEHALLRVAAMATLERLPGERRVLELETEAPPVRELHEHVGALAVVERFLIDNDTRLRVAVAEALAEQRSAELVVVALRAVSGGAPVQVLEVVAFLGAAVGGE